MSSCAVIMWLIRATVLLVLLASSNAKRDCEERMRFCMSRGNLREVCGTDHRTYQTRCHLAKVRCEGERNLRLKYRGECVGKSCLELSKRQEGQKMVLSYVPLCREDGTFSPIQCHNGSCWCVTPTGKPISDTAVISGMPVCPKNKGKTRRGSTRGRKPRTDCGQIERSNFVGGLVNMIRTEYNSTLTASAAKMTGEEFDRAAMEWKFSTLDQDTNHTLSTAEFRDLRQVMKRKLKPRKCVRSFIKFCDKDKNRVLSHEEWTACLKYQFNLLQGSISLDIGGLPGPQIQEVGKKSEESETNDCLTDRKSALETPREGENEFYVPECTPDGRFEKVQCYKSTGYCWCVHEDTGKPIPGTSVKDLDLKCDSVQSPVRPMNGCPDHRKQIFLRELKTILKQTVSTKNHVDLTGFMEWGKEKVEAYNHFSALDTNMNRFLDKKELKDFRLMIAEKVNGKFKRCGKKFPRYCDVNHDRKISLTEWFDCFVDKSEAPVEIVTSRPNRAGLGPLDLLKEYDD